jgi:uncharacterized SAM-binding protein YcdF (DUF218 family)
MLDDLSIKTLAEVALLPPGSLLLLLLAGLLIGRHRRGLGRVLVGFALLAFYLLATPLVAAALLAGLEPPAPLDETTAREAQAIVVLAADLAARTPEYRGPTIGALTVERMRYGARLQRLTGLPLLVTGGVLFRNTPPLAAVMAESFAEDFGVKVRWVEPTARTTEENAAFSAALLRQDGISRVLLVTHAWHMPRAALAFAAAGLEVIPAPTMFVRPATQLRGLLPSATALRNSYFALHEWLGLAWYRLVYLVDGRLAAS